MPVTLGFRPKTPSVLLDECPTDVQSETGPADIQLLGFLAPLDVIPDAIPIAGLGDDLAVLLFVLKKVWGEVSEDVKAKAQDKLKKWFDEDEIPSADDLFKDSATDTPV